ncbi:5480_t:CDS:2 [Funneliformis mosseae]|uniref:5480_t:CDS:1 n=1 Tax=Funneliformis mosseae TaxID=27381 RepID=A0A9N9DJL3_FUNMO|nr:5480_t:CDS:2 [Funneliformis mosseae]
MRTIHTNLIPIRNGCDDIIVEDIEAVDLYLPQYESLAQLLHDELPIEIFNELHFLPDPEPSIANPDHYKDFLSVYGTQTSESFVQVKWDN